MTWRAAAATRRGAWHVRRDLPNQDAHRTWTDGAATVVAVADGHGAPRHARSDVGSRLAVDAAVAALRAYLTEVEPAGTADVHHHLVTVVGPELVTRWREAVAEHAEQHDAPSGGTADVLAYGTTVLALVATPSWVGALQLGDGEVVLVDRGGAARRPMPLDPLLDGTLTTSLCQDDPLASLRYAVVPAAEVDLALVCTDGFGVGRVDGPDWWRPVGEQLAHHAATGGPDHVAERLPGWLEEPADVGGDDVTVGIVLRSPAQPDERSA